MEKLLGDFAKVRGLRGGAEIAETLHYLKDGNRMFTEKVISRIRSTAEYRDFWNAIISLESDEFYRVDKLKETYYKIFPDQSSGPLYD